MKKPVATTIVSPKATPAAVEHAKAHNIPIALRIPDAAAVSGLSRTTLYELMAEGKLAGIKAGGRRLILRRDLESYLEGLRAAD